jgi:hypothetical protein
MSEQRSIEALERENERLRKIIIQQEMGNFSIADTLTKGNELHMKLEGGLCHFISSAFIEHFIQTGANNFIVMGLNNPDTKERYDVTIQRVEGEHMGTQLQRLTNELNEAKKNLSQAGL